MFQATDSRNQRMNDNALHSRTLYIPSAITVHFLDPHTNDCSFLGTRRRKLGPGAISVSVSQPSQLAKFEAQMLLALVHGWRKRENGALARFCCWVTGLILTWLLLRMMVFFVVGAIRSVLTIRAFALFGLEICK